MKLFLILTISISLFAGDKKKTTAPEDPDKLEGTITEVQKEKLKRIQSQISEQKAIYAMKLAPIINENNSIIEEACKSIGVSQDAIDKQECKVDLDKGTISWVKPKVRSNNPAGGNTPTSTNNPFTPVPPKVDKDGKTPIPPVKDKNEDKY